MTQLSQSVLTQFRLHTVGTIHSATSFVFPIERTDGFLDFDFNLLFLQDVRVHVWLCSCPTLTNFSSGSINITLFCKVVMCFNNTCWISSVGFIPNFWSTCETARYHYVPQTIHPMNSTGSPSWSYRESLYYQLGDPKSTENEVYGVRSSGLYNLPSSYVGGDLNMRQNIQDILSTSNKIFYTDIFPTMTCNPQCSEIKNVLLPGQSVPDRPDISARVFRIKLRALVGFIIDEQVFSEVWAHIKSIEFYKRGLLHARCIYFMTPAWKVNWLIPTFVDVIISTENPNKQNSFLRQVVHKHNMRNPCAHLNHSAVYMIDNICSKHIPKDVINKTGIYGAPMFVTYCQRSHEFRGENAPWTYRTPEGFSITEAIDNSCAVPYSPKLSITFQCHLTVEIFVSRIGEFKHLFQYISKSSDRVTIWMVCSEQYCNEIGHFQDALYV